MNKDLMKIIFPDYPVKIMMSKTRRPKYYTEDYSKIPKRYTGEGFTMKNGKVYDINEQKYILKNASSLNKPRYQSLSYNMISTRLRIPVLIKLKAWMTPFMPRALNVKGPLAISAEVHDWPIPLIKDLDNMPIYYKAFLDLLTQRGMIIDDSKRYISRAGGFRFIPIKFKSDRKLVFIIETEKSELLINHLMYNLKPKKIVRIRYEGGCFLLQESSLSEPGCIEENQLLVLMNFGKTKVIKVYANRMFRQVFELCLNNNLKCVVTEEFYRIHSERITNLLLDKGIPVAIKIN